MEMETGEQTSGQLKGSAASSAEMGVYNAQRATLAAESPRAAYRHKAHRHRPRIRCTRPDKRDDPTNYRPAKKEIHHEDQTCIGFVAADNRRKEVHQTEEQKEKHALPLSTQPGNGPLNRDWPSLGVYVELAGMFRFSPTLVQHGCGRSVWRHRGPNLPGAANGKNRDSLCLRIRLYRSWK